MELHRRKFRKKGKEQIFTFIFDYDIATAQMRVAVTKNHTKFPHNKKDSRMIVEGRMNKNPLIFSIKPETNLVLWKKDFMDFYTTQWYKTEEKNPKTRWILNSLISNEKKHVSIVK